jgi:hypothetical protein
MKQWNTQLVATLTDDTEAVINEAEQRFSDMLATMAYIDNPHKPMATSVFSCNVWLSVYLSLKDKGIDVHEFGSALLEQIRSVPMPSPETPEDDRSRQEQFAEFIRGGEASQQEQIAGEFIFEAFLGTQDDFDWGMNIKSCAICASYSKYDALDLVPYMCATDDVMSDTQGLGLQRTGSIGVGAHHCDFIYKRGGEAARLQEQYPERIQVRKLPRDNK